MSATKMEAARAYEAGRAARRVPGKRIGDVPYRGKTPKVRVLHDEWCRGFSDEDTERKAKARAMAGGE